MRHDHDHDRERGASARMSPAHRTAAVELAPGRQLELVPGRGRSPSSHKSGESSCSLSLCKWHQNFCSSSLFCFRLLVCASRLQFVLFSVGNFYSYPASCMLCCVRSCRYRTGTGAEFSLPGAECTGLVLVFGDRCRARAQRCAGAVHLPRLLPNSQTGN